MEKKKDEKDKTDKKDKEKSKEEGKQIKLGVFEEDDYFEEFEQNYDFQRKDTIELKQWQADWEDEEINDNFEEILKAEIANNKK
jgi:26 proteasome complex subunit DSS1